ncbi:hypothetical protein K438DRAFT_1774050 [Mycena galopus ATCC 62051]|nr:hypothetical protein K438DRAFT_1774050 [Mycena galopus ATCC 62051]
MVPKSYSASDDKLEQDGEVGDGQPHENWGGSQYESADLSDLIEANKSEEPQLRMTSGHDYMVRGDLSCIAINCRQHGVRQLNATEETQIASELRILHQYPEDPIIQFGSAATEFEARHGGDGPWSRSTTDDRECLLQLQLANTFAMW